MSGLSSFGRIAGGLPKQKQALPAAFWTNMLPTAAVTLRLTIKTTDSQPILLDWGDGSSAEWLTHNVEASHNYAAGGPYNMRIYTPSRVTSIDSYSIGWISLYGTIHCTAIPFCSSLSATGAHILGLVDLALLDKLTALSIYGNSVTPMDLSNNKELTSVNVGGNWIITHTNINITGLTKLLAFRANHCVYATSITGVSALGQAAGTHTIEVQNCSLTATCIDAILAACVAGGQINGYLDYKAQTGDGHLDANRSAQGLADKNTLISRGWTVVIA